MANKSKAGRRRSDVMPSITVDRKTQYARISIGGKRHALGKAPGGKIAFEQQRAAARLWLEHLNGSPKVSDTANDQNRGPTIAELCIAYLDYADKYFIYRDGRYSHRRHTSSYGNAKRVCALLDPWYDTPTADFEPNNLEELMASQVAKGLKRSTINKYRKDCLTMFGWGVPKKLIPASVVDTLKYVRGLQPGRTDAVESEGVQAVADDVVEATIAQAHPVIAGMIRFQRLTGSRPTETCILRSSRIDKTDADIWVYFPEYWKTQLTAKKKDRRAIMIDEKLQEIIAPFLERPDDQYCFSPKEVYPPQADRLGEHYLEASYRCAIQRSAERAGVERWAPNQLRHTRSTEIKLSNGTAEEESALLGHGVIQKDYDHSKIELAKAALRKRKAS
ncbi:tyrosine-type recombinase/integrase [bacterium]|nr:tyrosine-type recombinase/integrase [bacterium]